MESNAKRKIVIAIDGHSSCGKSTFAKAIAARLGYIFIDTGAMYRAVTLYALENGGIVGGIVNEDAIVALLDQIEISFRLTQHEERVTSMSMASLSRARFAL